MIRLRKGSENWQLFRRIPKKYNVIDSRTFIWVSLHTPDENVAKVRADKVWKLLNKSWDAKLFEHRDQGDEYLREALRVAEFG